MKKIFKVIMGASLAAVLCGAAVFSLAKSSQTKEKLIADSSEITKKSVPDSALSEDTDKALPESEIYYGKVEKIIKDEEGNITALSMSSDRYGEYVMNLSDETVWIDSGEKTVSDSKTLTEGEYVYVFHSAASTFSMPPQSAAYAVVRNIPQDVGCAQYMKVNTAEQKDDVINITANNGTVSFKADKETTFSPYATKNIVTPKDLKEDCRIMVWYDYSSEETELRAYHIMLLPDNK